MTTPKPISLNRATDEIRTLYIENHEQADRRIEDFLSSELKALSAAQKVEYVKALVLSLDHTHPEANGSVSARDDVIARLFTLVFGKKISKEELSSDELLQKLADSLNTIFNALNQLIGLINKTFAGQATSQETIRQVMEFQLEDRERSQSLETYLGQIKKAFLEVQQTFIKTTHKMIEELLLELDPVRLKNDNGNGHLFEVSRKAEAFKLYEEQFEKIRKWFESGRLTRDFLREFEKNCQKITLN
ncbi:MAG: hypothetical protein EHM45_01130 [Desulfobacteraceae bacterium]|nr:MAG: hypothetical protein EHM45_01130 [Desulfobacteraceae bacterium]